MGFPEFGGESAAVQEHLTCKVQKIIGTRGAFAALRHDGSVITWGHRTYGGDCTGAREQLLSDVVEIVGNESAFAALKGDGAVITWGDDDCGGGGDIPSFRTPILQVSHGRMSSLQRQCVEIDAIVKCRRRRVRQKMAPNPPS